MAYTWVKEEPSVTAWSPLKTTSEKSNDNYGRWRLKCRGGWVDERTYAVECQIWHRKASGSKQGGTFRFIGTDIPMSGTFYVSSTTLVSTKKKTLWLIDDAATENKKYVLRGRCVSANASTARLTTEAEKIVAYPIVFNANGGVGTMSDNKFQGIPYVFPACDFTRNGFKFLEYNTETDRSGTKYLPGDTYEDDASLTVNAIWEGLAIAHINKNNEVKDSFEIFVNESGIAKRIVGIFVNKNGEAKQVV